MGVTYFILWMQEYLRLIVPITDTHSSTIAGTEGVKTVMAVVVAVVNTTERVTEPTVGPEP